MVTYPKIVSVIAPEITTLLAILRFLRQVWSKITYRLLPSATRIFFFFLKEMFKLNARILGYEFDWRRSGLGVPPKLQLFGPLAPRLPLPSSLGTNVS